MEKDLLKKPPRNPKERITDPPFFRKVGLISIVMVHLCYIITARSITKSAFTFSPFSNKWVLLGIVITFTVQLIIIYIPPYIGINPLKTAPIPLDWWLSILMIALSGFAVIEIEKWLAKR